MPASLAAFADELIKLGAKAPTGATRNPWQQTKSESEDTLYPEGRAKVLGSPEVRRRTEPPLAEIANKPFKSGVKPLPL